MDVQVTRHIAAPICSAVKEATKAAERVAPKHTAKTPFDQNENKEDIEITANIRKRRLMTREITHMKAFMAALDSTGPFSRVDELLTLSSQKPISWSQARRRLWGRKKQL